VTAGVDDAEPVAFGVGEHHEVRAGRVQVPVDPLGTWARSMTAFGDRYGTLAAGPVAARRGRGSSSPPQLGQRPLISSVQVGQKVHS
jgi:hypothetical protein